MSINNQEREKILSSLGDNFTREGEIVEEEEVKAYNSIPDLPENQKAREFLKNAPTKGLHLPLGQSVRVMQCWRCKAYGHRSGDSECPLNQAGNILLDAQRQAREDPMSRFVADKMTLKREKYERVLQLMELVDEIRKEEKERKDNKRKKKEIKKHSKKSKSSQ